MTDIDFDRTARLWLQDGPDQLADRVLAAALDEIHVTRQRRAWGPARRFPSMGNPMRLAALAAVLVVAVAGLNFLLPGNGGFGSLQPSPSPAPTPRGRIEEGDLTRLLPGTYVTADEFLVRVTLTVPAGWDGHLGGPYFLQLAKPSAQGEVMVSIFDKVYADPCHFDQGYLTPQPGPTVDHLVAAITSMPGVESTTPTDVTFGGYAGKQLTTTAPANFAGCTLSSDGYALWELPLGAVYTMIPRQRDRIWVLDVEGQRILIHIPEVPGQTPQLQAEVQGIVDSIRLAPRELTNPSASPPTP
jgi:hypothetical protein